MVKRYHDSNWMQSPTGEYVAYSDMMGQLELVQRQVNLAEGEVFELKDKLRISQERAAAFEHRIDCLRGGLDEIHGATWPDDYSIHRIIRCVLAQDNAAKADMRPASKSQQKRIDAQTSEGTVEMTYDLPVETIGLLRAELAATKK